MMWEKTGNLRISRFFDITHETVVTPATNFGILRMTLLYFFIYLHNRLTTNTTKHFIKCSMLEKKYGETAAIVFNAAFTQCKLWLPFETRQRYDTKSETVGLLKSIISDLGCPIIV